jgi:hypothetical protein
MINRVLFAAERHRTRLKGESNARLEDAIEEVQNEVNRAKLALFIKEPAND